jgi:glycerophosphoryl diester phosphodiesterase
MKRPDVDRPLIFAHRGANHVCPENTLPAFAAAVDLGADGVELDVQFSSDGELIIIHDYRLDKTTDGNGRVVSQPYEELKKLDAGIWFGPEFASTRIPTLDQVLDLLHGKLLINIELKSPEMSSTLGPDVVRCVRAHGMSDQVLLSSFNPFVLRAAKRAGPEIECALLTAPDLPGWMRSGVARRWSLAQGLHPELVMVDEQYVAEARKRGMPVRPWTVNEEADMRRLRDLGVDAIITDWPDRLKALLG